MAALDRDALHKDLAARFRGVPVSRPWSMGAEVELIPIVADTRLPAPIVSPDGPASFTFLSAVGKERSWEARTGPYGAPEFAVPRGGKISFEPGGQIEYSSSPNTSISELLGDVRDVITALKSRAADIGIELLEVGVDPVNPIENAPLLFDAPRYERMRDYFDSIGPYGSRMMRQTASFQLNCDAGPGDPVMQWRLLNRVAPYIVGMFGNSRWYASRDTGHASYRAHIWRNLDPSRTGHFPADAGDPVAEYVRFALDAPAFLVGPAGSPAKPFGVWLSESAVSFEDWTVHLTTLFPEVRPRGYFEIRSADSNPVGVHAALLAFVGGLVLDERSGRAALDTLENDEPSILPEAGQHGLAEPRFAARARDLFEVAVAGCRRLLPGVISGADLEKAAEFGGALTFRPQP